MTEPLHPSADPSALTAPVAIGLNAAILTVTACEPDVLVVPGLNGQWDALPFGPFTPLAHRTLEIGLRAWVSEQTGLDLGYVEQLYTFGDRGRHAQAGDQGPHVVSIGYLALLRAGAPAKGAVWRGIYQFFPWEDWRAGKPAVLDREIEPRLRAWAQEACEARGRPADRAARVRLCFGLDDGRFDDERVLDRYELLYEAGLVAEAARDGRPAAERWEGLPPLGRPMQYDHRRILATALGRLRGKLRYRPVVFELMPEDFTLFALQQTVEAIAGSPVHKQNFRRLVEQGGLVEPTGALALDTGGRPAKLYRFRREVILERPAPGLRVRSGRL